MSKSISNLRGPIPQKERRRKLIMIFSAYLICVILFLFGWFENVDSFVGFSIALTYSLTIALLPLSAGWWGIGPTKDMRIDERDQERLSWAYAASFKVTLLIIQVGIIIVMVINHFKTHLPILPIWQVAGFANASLFLLLTLPRIILAWTEPDLDDDQS